MVDQAASAGTKRAIKKAFEEGDEIYLPGAASDADFNSLLDKLRDVPDQYKRKGKRNEPS